MLQAKQVAAILLPRLLKPALFEIIVCSKTLNNTCKVSDKRGKVPTSFRHKTCSSS